MKIAMLGAKGIPSRFGGIETHVAELATRLVRSGHDVVTYVRPWYVGKHGGVRFNGVRLVRIPSIPTKNADAASHTLLSVLHAVLVERPDIYHFHGVGHALFACIPRIFAPRAKTVVTFHCVDRMHAKWGAFARLMLWLGEKAALIFPHETIVVSKTLAEYTKDVWHAGATYIPNGITPRRTSLDPALLDPFKLQPYRYALMVSRLVQHKGAHTLIAAWQKARDLDPVLMKDYKLAIAGDSAFTDDYVALLRAQVAHDPSIVMTGYQSGPSLEALFMGASFAVHPSQSEGLPIAVLEAMSYGKAVIGSDIPENKELLEESGVSFPVGDTNALAHAIIDLVRDPVRATALGRMSREVVETDYHWDDIAKKTMECYEAKKTAPLGVLALNKNL
jgi:glycosyltransferase involved in cell wall biosynthesis